MAHVLAAFMSRSRLCYLFVLSLFLFDAPAAAPSLNGQTGYINMPDGRIEPDGTLRLGVSNSDPYLTVWSSISLFPRLELSGRYTRIENVFSGYANYGDYKDKAFDGKLLLLNETAFTPSLLLGAQDFLGTGLFAANYIALGKRLADLDLTLGYGTERLNGWYGGLRYRPWGSKRWAWVAEYDVNDYASDLSAAQSGAARRDGGMNYGIEYRYGWLATQLSYADDQFGLNAYVSIPLNQREFIPKIHEPGPVTARSERVAIAEWQRDPVHAQALIRSLNQQGYKHVRLQLGADSVLLSLSNSRISSINRAVGRAARTVLYQGPADIHSIEITYVENDLPLRRYRFSDLAQLERFLERGTNWLQLEPSVEVEYAVVDADGLDRIDSQTIAESEQQEAALVETRVGGDGHLVSVKREDYFSSGFRLYPFNLRFFFNDPSGAYRYDTFALLKYQNHIAQGLFFSTSARMTLFEDVGEVAQPSNSVLPHVRSDVAEYNRQGDRVRLDTLMLNQYFQLRQRVYGRVAAGYYEQMFAGMGGQLLYLPPQSQWSVDVAIDALRQREPGDNLGFTDYDTVTALAALHYRIPEYGVTATARAGRFLAKDAGVRLELKRRWISGVEIGAWYTITDGDDITTPGSPDEPYRDKGIFLSVDLNSMLTKDTRERAHLSLSPWTRDVGQMVESPGDLYQLVEGVLFRGKSAADFSDLAR